MTPREMRQLELEAKAGRMDREMLEREYVLGVLTIEARDDTIADLGDKLENHEEENGQLRAKSVKLHREIVQLRKDADSVPYPGPSTHCAMCRNKLTDIKDVEKGLCGKCLPVFDEMYPDARIRNEEKPEEPHLRPVS